MRGIQAADTETDHYVRILQVNVAHPHVTELIYYPSGEHRASADHVVDQALSYRPFAL